jgi:outer membrane protein
MAVGVCSWLASGTARAEVVTLADVEARAQRPRPELVEREASIDKARAELLVVQARSAPTVGARVEGGVAPGGRPVEVTEAGGEGETYLVQGSKALGDSQAFVPVPRYAAVISGKITLFDFGRTKLGMRAAEAAVSAQRASLVSAKVELAHGARSAYLAWLEAHQTLQLAQRDLEVTHARSESVRGLIAEGARPATDLTLSLYDEQLAALRQTRAQRAADMARKGLSVVVQSELGEGDEPDPRVLEASAPSTAPGAAGTTAATPGQPETSTAGEAKDPSLDALEQQHRAALSAARAVDKAGSPTLDAAADVGVQGQDDNVFPVYRATLSLSVPIWDGGQRSAQAAVHRAEARGLEAHLRSVERSLREQQIAAKTRFETASAELKLTLDLLTTAETLLAQAEDHYRAGSDTLERVLGAQRSLVQARREVLTAKLETARARLDLTPVRVER